MTYYDIKSAFYRVVRQALFEAEAQRDAPFLALLHALGVPDTAIPELADHICETLLYLQKPKSRVICKHSLQISSVAAGSALTPGVPWSLPPRVRGRTPWRTCCLPFPSQRTYAPERALGDAGLASSLPPLRSAQAGGDASQSEAEAPCVGCVAWADDYVHLQVHQVPSQLLSAVQRATGILVTQATSLGMELTFARDKTALLVTSDCPRCPGDILCLDKEGLRVVDSYKHLGSITVAKGVA